MAIEIVEKVVMGEFVFEENRNPDIDEREAKSLDSEPVKKKVESAALLRERKRNFFLDYREYYEYEEGGDDY